MSGDIRIGPVRFWTNGSRTVAGTKINPAVSIHFGQRRLLWVRFGRFGLRLFSERYQGTHGIPKRWHYFFGGRVSIQVGNS